jgi:hypothetical protein
MAPMPAWCRPLIVVATSVCLGACESPTAPASPLLTSVVTSLTGTDGSIGVFHRGSVPCPSNNGGPLGDGCLGLPNIIATVFSGSIIAGGSGTVALHANESFQTVYMSVNGLDGFFALQLSRATSDATVVLSIASIPAGTFQSFWRLATPSGIVGVVTTILFAVQAAVGAPGN